MTGFTWNDNPTTPGVTFGYDAASRLTEVDNSNATISRWYFMDNQLRIETENVTGARSKTVTYTYDADGNRASTQYPDGYLFNYTYTGRNQLSGVTNFASYWYDKDGNMSQRNPNNGTSSAYTYDALDRATSIVHHLIGTTRTINYGYDPAGNNRLWAKRVINPVSSENNKGEVFSYDLADQAIGGQLDVLNPDQVQQPIPQTIIYDANGNRTWFTNIQYVTDNLSQYTSIGGSSLTYRADANLATYNGVTYGYDAPNRLTSVNNTAAFTYDGLNRQVSQTIGGVTTYSIWDDWNLIEEYQSANNWATTGIYVYGTGGLVTNQQFNYYYQDGSGSTSHLADYNGHLLEWYRYDLQGTPVFYNSSDQQIGASINGVRHLFTGQQWYSE
jgi:YD repeat-containing protein